MASIEIPWTDGYRWLNQHLPCRSSKAVVRQAEGGVRADDCPAFCPVLPYSSNSVFCLGNHLLNAVTTPSQLLPDAESDLIETLCIFQFANHEGFEIHRLSRTLAPLQLSSLAAGLTPASVKRRLRHSSLTTSSSLKQTAAISNSWVFYTASKRRRCSSTMSATAANNSDDDFRSKTQRSPLASQRAKQGVTPTEANRTGRVGGYFTLGYKEGFSQWVREISLSPCLPYHRNVHVVGEHTISRSRAHRPVLHTLPSAAPNSHRDWICSNINFGFQSLYFGDWKQQSALSNNELNNRSIWSSPMALEFSEAQW